MKTPHLIPALLATVIALGAPAVSAQNPTPIPAPTGSNPSAGQKHNIHRAIATIRPVGDSNVRGTVLFEETRDGVLVTARIGGLKPNARHSIQIHEFGDLGSEDAGSAGEHFNPDGHPNGTSDEQRRHAGDFGSLLADDDGNAVLELTVENLTFDLGSHGIIGRAVIVHEKADSGTQTAGNTGARIGAGVIGISKDAAKPPGQDTSGAAVRDGSGTETGTDPDDNRRRDADPDSTLSPARDPAPDPDAQRQELRDPGAER